MRFQLIPFLRRSTLPTEQHKCTFLPLLPTNTQANDMRLECQRQVQEYCTSWRQSTDIQCETIVINHYIYTRGFKFDRNISSWLECPVNGNTCIRCFSLPLKRSTPEVTLQNVSSLAPRRRSEPISFVASSLGSELRHLGSRAASNKDFLLHE